MVVELQHSTRTKSVRTSRAYVLANPDLLSPEEEHEYVLKVRDLPDDEKPREKLLRYGPGVLSASELLAVVLQMGTKREGVLAMTSRILKEYGDSGIVHQNDAKALANELGIPAVKACQIVACFALGQRFFTKPHNGLTLLRTPRQVYEYLKDMRELHKEQLRGVYLNSRYQVVHDEVISIGSINANIVHPRDVFKPALDYGAVGVIVAHNHPSGVAHASAADKAVTLQLIDAGKILGIDLLDHLIITATTFTSLL